MSQVIHAGYAPGKSTKDKVVDYVKRNLKDTAGTVASGAVMGAVTGAKTAEVVSKKGGKVSVGDRAAAAIGGAIMGAAGGAVTSVAKNSIGNALFGKK
ncbi:hypothetical protein [Brevibacillus sp. MER 51]|uniref:hypothetical protein n=1 Tax=Brevibacillus sp. MER 51 TaxID=2939560 RepID=UPI0020410FF1|nr:hypothetical protein [Brevibacillus sp. MER 51]MCM3144400.1 hypothetical protein [Brevibacillus sp. MER 51]